MSWQNIYATLQDDVSNKITTTSSRRGIASTIYLTVDNSITTSSAYTATIHGMEEELERKEKFLDKIEYWQQKNNPEKVKEWQDKLQKALAENQRKEENRYIEHNIKLRFDLKHQLNVNDKPVTKELLSLADSINNKDYVLALEQFLELCPDKNLMQKLIARKV